MKGNKPMEKKKELWRKYKGTTEEELCAAIRELWLTKYPNYIRMLNEVPNKLIEMEAKPFGPSIETDWVDCATDEKLEQAEKQKASKQSNNYHGRHILKDLEKFLSTPPMRDYFYEDEATALEDELYWRDPDAPLSEYIEADKKRDALVKKYSLK
jgi:hypothetical protein